MDRGSLAPARSWVYLWCRSCRPADHSPGPRTRSPPGRGPIHLRSRADPIALSDTLIDPSVDLVGAPSVAHRAQFHRSGKFASIPQPPKLALRIFDAALTEVGVIEKMHL